LIDLKDKKIIVIGLARTGAAVARCCRGLGARVLVVERSAKPADPVQAASLLSLGIELVFGAHDQQVLAGADLIIPSPGVSPSAPVLGQAIDSGLPVISEIELAFQLTSRPIIAVTGTNGKTTTTTLIGEILQAAGKAADVCGNIGRPMIEAVGTDASAPLVVEVSSFQLEFVDKFRPHIGVLLNIAPDHLDWHEDIEAYRAAKLKMFKHQTTRDWAVAGVDCASFIAGTRGRKLVFGGDRGVFTEGGWIRHDLNGESIGIVPIDELVVRGEHNVANAMAAAAVALIEGVDEETIALSLREFRGVEHRLEQVMRDNGVIFYNDSKATNPAAAITALRAFSGGIILLAGGRNKGNSFEELAREAAGRVKLAVLFGESAPDLSAALARHSVPVSRAGSLDEAVRTGAGAAGSGDVVLLAPACASFDMFSDYEERGRVFKAAVRAEVRSLAKRKSN